MGCGVQPAIIIRFGLLVSLMMRRRIERKDMMRMIKLMREEWPLNAQPHAFVSIPTSSANMTEWR